MTHKKARPFGRAFFVFTCGMKHLFLFLFASSIFNAHAQTTPDYVSCLPREVRLNTNLVPGYQKLADTTKIGFFLPNVDPVLVVGMKTPRWIVVKRGGSLYFVSRSYFDSNPAIPDKEALPQDTNGNILYSGVVAVSDANQGELYTRSKLWFASAFRSSKEVIQADDKADGYIVGKGYSRLYTSRYGDLWASNLLFTVKLAVKDGRYKYELTGFTFESFSSKYNNFTSSSIPAENIVFQRKLNGKQRGTVLQYKSDLHDAAQQLIESMKTGMGKSSDF